jgi:predicted RNA methylase
LTTPARSQNRCLLEAAPLVRKFAARIVAAAGARPVLDVACGSGRNALALAFLGCRVICIDRDLSRLEARRDHLRHSPFDKAFQQLTLVKMDLTRDAWLFGPKSVGGIINVHFLLSSL